MDAGANRTLLTDQGERPLDLVDPSGMTCLVLLIEGSEFAFDGCVYNVECSFGVVLEMIANYDFVEEQEGCTRTSGGISNERLMNCIVSLDSFLVLIFLK